MNTLLEIAGFLCGTAARAQIFEPLVADWQRELAGPGHSGLARARIVAGGATALAIAVATCLIAGCFTMNRTAWLIGLLTVALSSFSLLALQVALISRQSTIDLIPELRVWMALPRMLPFVVPLAILPTMMLWRGLRLSAREAVFTIAAATVLAVFVAGWLAPKTQGEPPMIDRWQEAMYQRMVETNPAARNYVRLTTPEQRAAARQKQRRDPRYIEFQARQTRPRWNTRTVIFGGVTMALGTLGWALGGIGRTRPVHAAAWWTLTCVTLMLFEGQVRFWNYLGFIRIDRAPNWAALAVFGTAAILMLFARRSTNESRPRTGPDADAGHHGFHATGS